MDEMVPDPLISNDNVMMNGHGYTNMVHSNEMPHANELVVRDETKPTAGPRGQKRKSAIWEHFTLVDVSEGCKRASCIHCDQSLAYSSGSKNSGTSHLTRHIAEWCRGLKDQQKSRRYRYSISNANAPFDQERSYSQLAKMIILNDYPLHIVQQPAFLSFVDSIQPSFKMVNIDTMEAEVYAIYHRERDNLQQALGNIPGRIGLTVGSVTTSQTLGYISVAAQFFDSEWRLHRRMLNFMMAPWPNSEDAVSKVITKGLSGWNMEDKLFTITLEHDCSSHDIYSANLINHLSGDNVLMLKGQLFVVRCYANILNAVAHDVLASAHNVVYLIRESMKFIKADSAHERRFVEIAHQLKISGDNILCLDVTTEWNTTYLMLLAALEYRQVFTLMESCYDSYSTAPSTEDWEKAKAACGFLKTMYTSAVKIITEEGNPTANIFFHEACLLQQELQDGTAHEDAVVRGMAIGAHERFDRYWKDCNVVLAIAVAMDPRFKMKIVEFTYSKIYGPTDAAKYVKVVHDAVLELYREYVAQPLPLSPVYIDPVPAADDGLPAVETLAPSSTADAGLEDFDMYLSEVTAMVQPPSKHDLELYLEEALVQRTPGFDVVRWWQGNTGRYPTLSRMARDVLAIPMSTAGVGSSVFLAGNGGGGRTLDDYRSSLQPQLVEALFCAKDWLLYSP
ncbi:zinc finger BED domain-containing protein RICESLEEPER 4-like [Oryza brachyantha]|uniref:zinc finger BED domain-containing protein RICESLEEPER 4-like n=1 Tax=Oryza brachyantha TaxID=4533 RepID=UPI001ADD1914|nr:zinc finger BED domain-containing protein RICESLEEPER 4-like [Oryza brachyantha]